LVSGDSDLRCDLLNRKWRHRIGDLKVIHG